MRCSIYVLNHFVLLKLPCSVDIFLDHACTAWLNVIAFVFSSHEVVIFTYVSLDIFVK